MTSILNRNKVNKDFSRVPQIKRPRSAFPLSWKRVQSMNAGDLVPIMCREVIPGSTYDIDLDIFGRLMPQVAPPLDDLILKTYFFFVPSRLVWDNFSKQHGERENPDDSIDYITPVVEAPSGGFAVGSIYDYLGIPTGVEISVNALPLRSINLIYNQYFRSENLQDSLTVNKGDTDDLYTIYNIFKKNKSADYFTRALPELQKGPSVMLPIGTEAPVVGNGLALGLTDGTNEAGIRGWANEGTFPATNKTSIKKAVGTSETGNSGLANTKVWGVSTNAENSGLKVLLNQAVGASISALRQLIDTQLILEADNRNGTRYTEILESRYGCTNPDLRLQRPQYLGGTTKVVTTNPVTQTSATNIEVTTGKARTPQGNLAANSLVGDSGNIIRQSFGEFGYIIGFACLTTEPSYQQGLHPMWERLTRFDYYYPEFNGLSDQIVKNVNIYAQDSDVVDTDGNVVNDKAFGYQERNSEYKTAFNEICGKLRSTATGSLDVWHYAEKFENLPELNEDFITDKTKEILDRSIAVQNEPQFLLQCEFTGVEYLPLPVYNIPRIESIL